MSNKYLEKIAKTTEHKGNSWNINAIPAYAIGSVGAGLAAAIPAHPMMENVMSHIDRKESISGADLGTVKKMMRDNNLHHHTTFNTRHHNVDKHFDANRKGAWQDVGKGIIHAPPGPAYLPTGMFGGKKNFVVGVKKHGGGTVGKDIIMHELGHAKDYASHGGLKTGFKLGGRVAAIGSVAALTNDKTRDYAVPLAVAGALPTLRDEGMANYHAYKGIKAHKGAAAAGRYLKKVVPAQMGHYGMGAAAAVGGVYAGKKILDYIDKNK